MFFKIFASIYLKDTKEFADYYSAMICIIDLYYRYIDKVSVDQCAPHPDEVTARFTKCWH